MNELDNHLLPWIKKSDIGGIVYIRPWLVNNSKDNIIITYRHWRKGIYHIVGFNHSYFNLETAQQKYDELLVIGGCILIQEHEVERYKKLLLLL